MRAALLGLALLAAPGAATNPAPNPAPVRTVVRSAPQAFPFLREYWRLDAPSRSRFTMTYRLAERNRPVGAALTLVDGATETPLTSTPDGWLTRLPTAEAFARGARVREETPAAVHASLQLTPEAVVADPGSIEVAELDAAAAQIDRVAHRAGPLGFLIPKFTRAMFSGAEGGSAVEADGTLSPLEMEHGEPVLDFGPGGKGAEARTVRFTRPPYHVLLLPVWGRRAARP